MGTPNSTDYDPLSMTPNDLCKSAFEEEKTLSDELTKAVDELLKRLKPILKYITKLVDDQHFIEICGHASDTSSLLVLTRDGEWGQIFKNIEDKKVKVSSNAWAFYPFGRIIDGLKEAFKRAEEERTKRLQGLRAARKKLEEINKILNPPITRS